MTNLTPDQSAWVFGNRGYLRHNQRRQEHLAGLGLDLHGRSVLELGAGAGYHTTFFLDRGCRVTSVEPRAENCVVYQDGLRDCGYVNLARGPTLIQAPVEGVDAVLRERFDVVYCYGLLYHLADPAAALVLMAKWCGDLLLLETEVAFGADEAVNPTPEDVVNPSQAMSGMGCRPTRPWIFRRLSELFEHVYLPTTQPVHEDYPLDWLQPDAWRAAVRAVFVASRRPLASPVLVDHVPDKQVRAP